MREAEDRIGNPDLGVVDAEALVDKSVESLDTLSTDRRFAKQALLSFQSVAAVSLERLFGSRVACSTSQAYGPERLCFSPCRPQPKPAAKAEGPAKRSAIMNSPSLFDWYYILRAHHQWTMFQAIRYALWLAR